MASVALIPTPLARAAVAAGRNPRNNGTCGIFDVAGRLGQAHRRPAFLCTYLDGLIASAGFPAPFPVLRAGVLTDEVHTDSRWPLVAVEAWFDDRLPPGARGLVAQAERVEIDSRLSSRAFLLFGGAA